MSDRSRIRSRFQKHQALLLCHIARTHPSKLRDFHLETHHSADGVSRRPDWSVSIAVATRKPCSCSMPRTSFAQMDRNTVLGLRRLQGLCHPSQRLLQRICNLIVGQVTLNPKRPEALETNCSPCNKAADLKGLVSSGAVLSHVIIENSVV